MRQPELILGNIFVRPNRLTSAGDTCRGHRHQFDHVTFVTKGAIEIARTVDGVTERTTVYAPGHPQFDGRWYLLIRADVEHELTALEANSWFDCVYSHRDPQGRVTQAITGWEQAYR